MTFLDRTRELTRLQRGLETDEGRLGLPATSLDGRHLLIGEVKWSERPATAVDLQSTYRNLVSKGMPGGLQADGRQIHHVVFFPERTETSLRE